MHVVAMGLALLVAIAIIVVGVLYLARPIVASRGFGLPLPGDGPNVPWWLRLKGTRDVVSGLVVLTFLTLGQARTVGIVLLVYALIPLGDMLTVLAAKGSPRHAFGIHGVTTLVMLLAAVPLIEGA